VSEKYGFIDAQCADAPAAGGNAPTITCMCRWLGVSKSASSELAPRPIAAQKRTRSSRQATVGRPGEGICPRHS
jgi:hypothetical protein